MSREWPMPEELFRDATPDEDTACNLVVDGCAVDATHVVDEHPEYGVCDGHYRVLEARAQFLRTFGGPLG